MSPVLSDPLLEDVEFREMDIVLNNVEGYYIDIDWILGRQGARRHEVTQLTLRTSAGGEIWQRLEDTIAHWGRGGMDILALARLVVSTFTRELLESSTCNAFTPPSSSKNCLMCSEEHPALRARKT
jgi:hypothetical protein